MLRRSRGQARIGFDTGTLFRYHSILAPFNSFVLFLTMTGEASLVGEVGAVLKTGIPTIRVPSAIG